MASDALQDYEMDLVAKADKIAHGFCQRVPGSHVFVKLANTDRLVPFGFAGPEASEDQQDLISLVDDVCSATMAKGAVYDTGNHPASPAIQGSNEATLQASGAIMALPIRNKQGKAIGAICAFCRKPRIWSDYEKLSLEFARCQTEYLLATTDLTNQVGTLSQALKEYDDIATMIAAHAEQTFSVHGPSGDLLFATNALLDHVELDVLETQMRKMGKMTTVSASPLGDSDEPDDASASAYAAVASDTAVASSKQVWRARVRSRSKQASFVHWELDDA